METWGPLWGMAGEHSRYKTESRRLVRQRHPTLPDADVEKQAQLEFERGARSFMETTLAEAQRLRPNARFGYYGYPSCYGYLDWREPRGMDPGGWAEAASCRPETREANDDLLSWLWEAVDVLLPSMYALSRNAKYNDMLVGNELREARRVEAALSTPKPVYFYGWYYPFAGAPTTPEPPLCSRNRFGACKPQPLRSVPSEKRRFARSETEGSGTDNRSCFNSEAMMASQITVPAEHGIAGAVVWGSGDDVYSRSDCSRVKGYVETTLGPLARQVIPTPSHL